MCEGEAVTWIGLILVSLGILATAQIKAREAESGLRLAEAFLALVTRIEREIRMYRTPLSVILASDGGVLEDIGFMQMARDALSSGIPPVCPDKRLGSAERDAVERLFAELGSASAAEEVERCRQAAEILSASCEARKRDLPIKKRLYRATALSAALMLLILFA